MEERDGSDLADQLDGGSCPSSRSTGWRDKAGQLEDVPDLDRNAIDRMAKTSRPHN
jgi:hypothetical protein